MRASMHFPGARVRERRVLKCDGSGACVRACSCVQGKTLFISDISEDVVLSPSAIRLTHTHTHSFTHPLTHTRTHPHTIGWLIGLSAAGVDRFPKITGGVVSWAEHHVIYVGSAGLGV